MNGARRGNNAALCSLYLQATLVSKHTDLKLALKKIAPLSYFGMCIV